MSFFTAQDGSRFLVTDIQHIEPIQQDAEATVLWLRGDRSVLVTKADLERLMALPSALVPAQSNTYVVTLVSDDPNELDVIQRTAVVAWALGFDGVVRAVTIDGVSSEGAHDLTVETSDGFVTARGAHRWMSVEAWLRDQVNRPHAA